MAKAYMLTTVDNPFDPFEDFEKWYQFDEEKGYHSCQRLARFTNNSDFMSDVEQREDQSKAIDKIIALDFTNLYKKVSKDL